MNSAWRGAVTRAMMTGMSHQTDFYEDDEPRERIQAARARAVDGYTASRAGTSASAPRLISRVVHAGWVAPPRQIGFTTSANVHDGRVSAR